MLVLLAEEFKNYTAEIESSVINIPTNFRKD
jgi:hypothetical protein